MGFRAWACGAALVAGGALAADLPVVHPDSIVAKYGPPDSTYSSEVERPRPPIVTRQLTYAREKVRFVFTPDVPMGSPPPYRRWLLMGAQDTDTDQVLRTDAINARMAARERGRRAR